MLLFLRALPRMPRPALPEIKLDIVTRAVDQVAKKYYGDEDAQKKMEIKRHYL